MFSIREGLVKLALEDIRSLKPHERVLPELIKSLEKSLLEDKVVKDPITVDERTLVVLDGMHRVSALRELGYSYIPCSLIDYMLPAVQLRAWYRVIKGPMPASEIVTLIRKSFKDLKLVDVNTIDADKMVNEGRGVCAFRSSGSAWLMTTGKRLNCREAYDLISEIEERLRKENFKIIYQTEFDAKTMVLYDKSATCMIVPTVTKEDVIHIAAKGEVFAPKASRHVFPTRILGVDVPLELLKGNQLNLDKANEEFQNSLSSRKIVKLPGGQIVDGRRYEELLYVFES
jgi:hypothetical protein